MKVPHDEGVANHIGLESCGGCGNTVAEALTGESVGGQLSSEIEYEYGDRRKFGRKFG